EIERLYRPRIQYSEPILAPSDVHLRLNLAVDTPLVSRRCACPHNLEQLVAPVGRGGAESLLGEYERDVGFAVYSRQLKRSLCGKLVTRVRLIVRNVHPVQAQVVVVRSL